MTLAYLLVHFPDALEADLQRFYQVDLVDMYRGTVSVRKITVLSQFLPRGAALWQMIGGPSAITDETETGWNQEHYLANLAWQNAGGKGQRPKPRPMPKGIKAQKDAARRAENQALAWKRKHAGHN